MRILLVNTYHYLRGGDCTYTFNLFDLLKSKGHEIKFFSMHHPQNFPSSEEKYFLDYIDYVELNKNKSLANSVKVLYRSIYYSKARSKIRELIRDFNPNIVHLQNIHAHITPSILFEIKKYNIPVVWTLHDYKLICPNSHYLIDKTGEICEACKSGLYYKPIFKRCKKNSLMASIAISIEAYVHHILKIRNMVDYYLTPSNFLKNKLIQYGFKNDKIVHIPIFLKNEKFIFNDQSSDYILYFGRIDYIKGIIPLLLAMKKLKNINLKIVGNVADRIEKDFYGNLGVNTEYLGFKSGKELDEIIKDSTAVILPSLWYENQPFSILEAFAFGKPVITSKLGGLKELVDDNIKGYLVEPGNINQIAEAIKKIIDNKQKTLEMGRNAFEYVKENHNPEKHYQKLMEIYNKLI